MNTQTIALHLREHNLKVTPQRLKIVESLNTYGHLNIDMLYAEVQKSYPSVSLATVYKNIALMTEKQLLEEVKIPESKSVFEVKKAPHHHLHCRRCGKIEDVVIDCSGICRIAEEKSGYLVERTETVFSGLCPDCRSGS